MRYSVVVFFLAVEMRCEYMKVPLWKNMRGSESESENHLSFDLYLHFWALKLICLLISATDCALKYSRKIENN